MVGKVDVPLKEDLFNIMKRRRTELAKILLSKYNCNVTFSCGDLEGGGGGAVASSPRSVEEKRFEVTLESGVKVSVWKADLTSFHADAVVNAANERLQHIGGLAGALATAGGRLIQLDSSDHVRRHGLVATGSAVMMDGHLLPCEKIIHAVGPRLTRNFSQKDLDVAARLLSKTVSHVIDLVAASGLHSVAIPAISSGIFNFPLDKCAETIVRALQHARYPKDIRLVNNDELTVKAMKSACEKELDRHQHTRGASSPIKPSGERRTGSAYFGNVNVTLKRGLIEDEQVRTSTFTSSRSVPLCCCRSCFNIVPVCLATD